MNIEPITWETLRKELNDSKNPVLQKEEWCTVVYVNDIKEPFRSNIFLWMWNSLVTSDQLNHITFRSGTRFKDVSVRGCPFFAFYGVKP